MSVFIWVGFVFVSGIYLDANQRFQDFLGYDNEALQKTTMFALTHPEDLKATYEMVDISF